MSISIIQLGRAILQSDYEAFLPDGMGLSLPVPACFEGKNCLGAFVYSVRDGRCGPPQGVFYLSLALRVLGYRPADQSRLGEKSLPGLSHEQKRSALQALEDLAAPALAAFTAPMPDLQTLLRYRQLLRTLAGEAIAYYEAVFPDFFGLCGGQP